MEIQTCKSSDYMMAQSMRVADIRRKQSTMGMSQGQHQYGIPEFHGTALGNLGTFCLLGSLSLITCISSKRLSFKELYWSVPGTES